MDADTVLADGGVGCPEVAFGDRVAGPISASVKQVPWRAMSEWLTQRQNRSQSEHPQTFAVEALAQVQ
jgi:hypothetical protein